MKTEVTKSGAGASSDANHFAALNVNFSSAAVRFVQVGAGK